MKILTNAVPTWVSVSFLISTLIAAFFITSKIYKASIASNFSIKQSITHRNIVFLFLSLYFVYVSGMSFTGLFQQNVMPPKILLFTTLPLLLFYFLVVFRSKIYKTFLQNILLSDLILLHSLRFVGTFFILAYYYHALPKYFALSAGIGDILAAIFALVVAKMTLNKTKNHKKYVLAWNIFGFWDIMNVVVTAIIISKHAINLPASPIAEMGNFPFCLIPAFAPATIIFLHMVIFKKLKLEQ